MADTMQIDEDPPASTNRKRSIRQRDGNSDDDQAQVDVVDFGHQDTSPKRLRNRNGGITARRVIHYNAQALLSNLAFTRLFVTANFHNYNPSSSLIIMCFVSHREDLYEALWYVHLPDNSATMVAKCNSEALPDLYVFAPTLQAIAINLGPCENPHPVHGLPVHGPEDLREDVLDNLNTFRHAIDHMDDAIAAVDATQTCVWNGADFESSAFSGSSFWTVFGGS